MPNSLILQGEVEHEASKLLQVLILDKLSKRGFNVLAVQG